MEPKVVMIKSRIISFTIPEMTKLEYKEIFEDLLEVATKHSILIPQIEIKIIDEKINDR